jgi:glycosyltransferase involved in cell wall biosynthesis
MTNPPSILEIAGNANRPLWSVMIPTYNCANYLRQTLESVLAQDPGLDQMQIEVVDDCSTKDDPEAVVRDVGKGRVQFHRKPQNEGATANFNTCIQRSRGKLVHILHGDDFVERTFYNKTASCFDEHPTCSAVINRVFVVDEAGALENLSPRVKSLEVPCNDVRELLLSNPLRTPGVVVRRAFYESHGGFMPTLVHTADWEMWVRVIKRGAGMVINQPLSSYRMFPSNDTSRLMKTGENLLDYMRLANSLERLAPDVFSRHDFFQMVADTAYHQAQRYVSMGDREAAKANLNIWRQVASPKTKIRAWLGAFKTSFRRR